MKLLMISILTAVFTAHSSFAHKKMPKEFDSSKVELFLKEYAQLVTANYKMTVQLTEKLQSQINNLVKNPSEENLKAAREAWIEARKHYSKTEAYRFYGGPIDHEEHGPEGLINSWPMDESHVDYVKGNPNAGIVNQSQKFPVIDKKVIASLNTKDGEANVSSGYHAIEFLLWGQDFNSKGPGQRSSEDYVIGKGKNADRRGKYLTLTTELLIENLKSVLSHWENGTYLNTMLKQDQKLMVQKIMTGLTTLAADEMAGERMAVAFEKNDQENEQDCFSDNSLRDLAANLEGISEVYAVASKIFDNEKLNSKILAQINENRNLYKSVDVPFDQVVSDPKSKHRKTTNKIIGGLHKQAKLMGGLAKEYGLELNVQ